MTTEVQAKARKELPKVLERAINKTNEEIGRLRSQIESAVLDASGNALEHYLVTETGLRDIDPDTAASGQNYKSHLENAEKLYALSTTELAEAEQRLRVLKEVKKNVASGDFPF